MERRTGEAPIKTEFRKEKWQEGDQEDVSTSSGVFGDTENEGNLLNKHDKHKKGRGANKGQRGKKRIEDAVLICNKVAVDQECTNPNCRFSHDLQAYLESKPEDLGDKCVRFDLLGYCPNGYKCRFLKAHLDENKKLVVNETITSKNPVLNKGGIRPETQAALSAHKLEFPKTKAYMLEVEAEKEAEERMMEANRKRKLEAFLEKPKLSGSTVANEDTTPTKTDDHAVKDTPAHQDLPDIDMNVKPQEEKPIGPIDTKYKKLIDFRNKTYLAPLTTVGNLPFRRICKGFGVDITCGEMAFVPELLKGHQSEWALTKRHVSEDLFGVQICGGNVEQVVKACEVINQEIDADFVDLNMGCPIDLVFNKGAGSALLGTRGKMTKILRGMQVVLDVPVTAKFRMGIKDSECIANKIVTKLDDLDIALGTLHGRSRMQRYTRLADWEYIREMKKVAKKVPLFGNGDVFSYEEYNKNKEESGVDGIMIGRGALIKPWLFEEIKTQRHWDISSRERFEMMKRFCDFGMEHWGTDTQGINTTRRFLCEWQSFLYRYIPVGLLEVVPQKLNERAPPYYGRDELETLMASPNAKDWIQLSERLLGPAPEGFEFKPKHKSNSFEG